MTTVASDVVIIQSDVKTVGSDLVITNAIVDTIASDVVVVMSDVKQVVSDVNIIQSDIKILDPIIDTTASDVVVIQSDVKALMSRSGEGTFVTKTITYGGSVSYAAFTVTGCVACKVIGYVTTATTSHSDSTSVGTTTSAGGLIAATAGTAMQTVGQVWVDSAPSKFETFPAGMSAIGAGEDIAVVGTANITGGVVELYCFYIPLSSDGAISAA